MRALEKNIYLAMSSEVWSTGPVIRLTKSFEGLCMFEKQRVREKTVMH